MKKILDNLKKIKEIDKSDMAGLIKSFPSFSESACQIKEIPEFDYCSGKSCPEGTPWGFALFDNIFFSGLGGSALSGELISNLLSSSLSIPIFVNRDYCIPSFVNKKTLSILLSYSGNTEETLNVYKLCQKREAKIVCVSSGGELSRLAKDDGVPLFTVPGGFPPRTALPLLLFPVLLLISRLFSVDLGEEIEETSNTLKEVSQNNSLEIPFSDNRAKKIAGALFQKIPSIYGDNRISGAVYRWRTQIAENAKSFSSHHLFPEMNHNEIEAFESPKEILSSFYLIFLRHGYEFQKTSKRIEITQDLLKEKTGGIIEIKGEGKGKLSQILSLILIGDWVSFYLSILNKIDPTPVNKITLLKKRLQ